MKEILLLAVILFGGTVFAAAIDPVIFQDDFNNCTRSPRWQAPVAGNFTVAADGLHIRSDKENPVIQAGDAGWRQYGVEVKFSRRQYAPFNLYACMQYPNFYRVVINPPSQGTVLLQKSGTGGIVTLKSALYRDSINNYENLTLRLAVDGGSLAVEINGKTLIEYKDAAPLPGGGIALGGGFGSDFTVTAVKVISLKDAVPAKVLPPPVMTDRQERPEIRNGCFYYRGQPTFMLGLNDTSNFWEFGEKNAKPPFQPNDLLTDMMDVKRANMLGINSDHVYTRPRQVCDLNLDELGLNPEQADLLLGNPYRQHWEGRAKHRAGLGSLPLVIDFSSLWLDICFDKGVLKRVKLAGAPEAICHSGGFLPYNPEEPLGGKIYNLYFREGARYWLNQGKTNPWVYELTNEVQWYHSTHPRNKALFAAWLKRKYHDDLKELHAAWRDTALRSFEQAAGMNPEVNRAMYGEWMQFLGDRFVEFFQDGVKAVRSVDQRPDTYCDIEISVASLWHANNGIDYYKLMKAADLFGTEGGVAFGLFQKQKVNYLFEVMNSKRIETMFDCDLATTFAQGKPVMNQESYISRHHAELGRVTTRRSDFPTMLWFEVFHNYSGSQIYAWWKGGRDFNWKTLDDAKAEGRKQPPSMLNPYLYPLDALAGIKDFQNEVSALAPQVLPGPRIRREVAVLYSLPTVWHNPLPEASAGQIYNYQKHCINWYEALQRLHVPSGVICEQDLNEHGAGNYRVIIIPYSKYIFAATLSKLEEFVRNGGIVMACGSSLEYDELVNPVTSGQLLGVRKSGSLPEKSAAGVLLPDRRRLAPAACNTFSLTSAMPVLTREDGRPWVTVNVIGKGKVFYIGVENLDIAGMSAVAAKLLNDGGYTPPWQLKGLEGATPDEMEVQAINRPDTGLYFLCNWNGRQAATALFLPPVPADGGDQWRVNDAVSGASYLTKSGSDIWTAEDLRGGIPVLLPSQERVLLKISSRPQPASSVPAWTLERCRELLPVVQKRLDAELAGYDRELTQAQELQQQAVNDARKGYTVEPSRCFFINLSGVVNMGFKDETAGDGKGGWTDQGKMDMRELPVGLRTMAGVPFQIIDPAANQGKSCLMLKGHIDWLPAESRPVPVERKVRNLYFLHGSAWSTLQEKYFEYVMTYTDGSESRFPIRGGSEVADWYEPKPVNNGAIAWEGANPLCRHIGIYCTKWSNPYPDKQVLSIRAVTAGTEAVPGIIAITGEE